MYETSTYMAISQLGCLLNGFRSCLDSKHAVTGYIIKITRLGKDPMVHEQVYLHYMKI